MYISRMNTANDKTFECLIHRAFSVEKHGSLASDLKYVHDHSNFELTFFLLTQLEP